MFLRKPLTLTLILTLLTVLMMAPAGLYAQAGGLSSETLLPKVAVFLPDHPLNSEAQWNDYLGRIPGTEASLIVELKNAGFPVISPEDIRQKLSFAQAQALMGETPPVKAVGKELGAGILFIGYASPAEAAAGSDSVRALANVSSYRVVNEERLGSATATARAKFKDLVIAGRYACEGAVKMLTPNLVTRTLERWKDYDTKAAIIVLEVSGIQRKGRVFILREDLRKRVDGIMDIRHRTFVPGKAELDVQYQGTARELARHLSELIDVPLKVVSVDEGRIVATVK